MRARILAFVVCGLLLPLLAVAADKEKDKDKKEDAVKKLELKGLKRDKAEGDVKKPKEITSAEELDKAFPEQEVQASLKKEVDFSKQKLLFFQWSGSGGDKLEFEVKDGKKAPEAIFQYKRGLTRDLRQHFHLFVIAKDATWKVEDAK